MWLSPGFGPRDVAIVYHTDFNHLAYRGEEFFVSLEQQQLFHWLACNDIDGPNLRCKIPSSLQIHTPSPRLHAVERLKNYNKEDVDLDHFDGLITKSSKSNDCEEDMFAELVHTLRSNRGTNTAFSSSLDDADLPASTAASTKDMLKNNFFECCELADEMGMASVLQEKLEDFKRDAYGMKRKPKNNSDCLANKKQKKGGGTVAMTNTKHIGGPGRRKNTRYMPK